MKTVFIHAEVECSIDLDEELKKNIEKLPKPIGLATTVQHEKLLDTLKGQINDSFIVGSVLGCNCKQAEEIKEKVSCFLFIGTGKFHPLNIAMKTGKQVFCLDPIANKLYELDTTEIEKLNKKKKGSYLKFLTSKSIGVIATTKSGQEHLDIALKLQEKLKEEGKSAYVLLADNIDTAGLKDFTFIDCFVNTACPRLIEGSEVSMINHEDLEIYSQLASNL